MIEMLSLMQGYKLEVQSIGGDRYRRCCPFSDHDDSSPSFIIYKSTNSFYCFGCTIGGGPLQFMMRYEKISREDAQKKLGTGDLLSEVNRMLQPAAEEEKTFNTEVNFVISSLVRDALQQGRDWLKIQSFLQDLDRKLCVEKLTEQQAKQAISSAQDLLHE